MTEHLPSFITAALAETLLDHSDLGVAVLDAEARILVWNDWLARRTGLDSSRAQGHTLAELFPALPEAVSHALSAVLRQGEPRLLSPVLHTAWLPCLAPIRQLVRLLPLPGPADTVAGALLLVQDVTAQFEYEQTAEETLRRSAIKNQAILEAIPDLMFCIASDGTLLDYKAPHEGALCLPPDQFVGRRLAEVLPAEVAQLAMHYVAEALRTGQAQTFEYRLPLNGDLHDYEARLVTLGQAEVLAIVRDITAQKQAESQLAYQAQLLASVSDAVIASDAQFVLTSWNRAAEQIYGWTAPEALGRPGRDVFRSEFIGIERAEALRLLTETGQFRGELIQYRKDGTPIWIEATSMALRDQAGQISGYVSVNRDITARKQAEEALRRRAAQLEALRQVGLEMAAELDLDRLLQSIVARAGELINASSGGLYLYDAAQDVLVRRVSVGEYPLPLGLVRRRGEGLSGQVWQSGQLLRVDDYRQWPGRATTPAEPRVAAAMAAPVRWGDEFLGVLTTSALPDSRPPFSDEEAELLALFAAQAASAIHNARLYDEIRRRNRELALLNRVIAASAESQQVETILEIACRELRQAFDVPRAIAALFDERPDEVTVITDVRPDDRPPLLGLRIPLSDLLRQALHAEQQVVVIDDAQTDPRLEPNRDLLRRFDTGSLLILPLLANGSTAGVLLLGTRQPRSFSPAQVELARRVAEQVSGALSRAHLLEAQQRLSTAVEQAPDSILITDTEGRIVYVNAAFERTTGYSRAEALGQTPRLLKSGKHDAAFYHHLWSTIRAGQVWQGQFINRKKDGSLFTEDATITPVRNAAGEIVHYVATMRDVTRELQLEEQFRQAQKMEALGRLAGGVAHDFNNLLTIVHLSTRLLEKQLHPQDPLWVHVQRIQDAGRRATDLTRQLLSFSRQEVAQPQILDLNRIVSDASRMLQRILGEDIELLTVLADDLHPVFADATHLDQVILNLATNARDAMPDGGRLTIETANIRLDETYAARHVGVAPGDYVLLAVTDSGCGMSTEVKSRIFEPFFTTKERGQGTGLGLATVFGIVKQSRGHIWVYSEPGQGTTFKIYLPRAAETALQSGAEPRPAVSTGRALRSETILLVEDADDIRTLAADILGAHGYRLLLARDGTEGLRLAEQHDGPIHLVLTDVVMPQMSGAELIRRLREQRPQTRVLYMSGYTDNVIAHHGILEPGVAFLPKPFTLEALLDKVRAVLRD